MCRVCGCWHTALHRLCCWERWRAFGLQWRVTKTNGVWIGCTCRHGAHSARDGQFNEISDAFRLTMATLTQGGSLPPVWRSSPARSFRCTRHLALCVIWWPSVAQRDSGTLAMLAICPASVAKPRRAVPSYGLMPKCGEAVCARNRHARSSPRAASHATRTKTFGSRMRACKPSGVAPKCIRLVSPVAVLWPARRRLPSTPAAAQPLAHLVLVCV